ncbi:MAG TPA: hypothetical protein ACN46Q_09490 [Prochlorococcus sp.]
MLPSVLAMALELSPLMIGGIVLAAVVVLGANVFFGMQQRKMMNDHEAEKKKDVVKT